MVLVRIMYIDITIGLNLNDISCGHFVSECEQTLPASNVGLGRLRRPNLQGLMYNHSLALKYPRRAPCSVLEDRLPTLICHCKPLKHLVQTHFLLDGPSSVGSVPYSGKTKG